MNDKIIIVQEQTRISKHLVSAGKRHSIEISGAFMMFQVALPFCTPLKQVAGRITFLKFIVASKA